MKTIFLALALLIILVILSGLIVLSIRMLQTQSSLLQSDFLRGKVPDPAPEGLYHGTSPGYQGSWQGKSFNAAQSSGINIFRQADGSTSQAYPFATRVGQGVTDPSVKVLKIDYNLPQNPLWLRHILDEIVEIEPGHYLGKLQLRVMGQVYFSAGWFELKK
jgi:hypothetical protein